MKEYTRALLELRVFRAVRAWVEWARDECEAAANAAIITRLLHARRLLVSWRRVVAGVACSRQLDGLPVRSTTRARGGEEEATELRELNGSSHGGRRTAVCASEPTPADPSAKLAAVGCTVSSEEEVELIDEEVEVVEVEAQPDEEEVAALRASALLANWGS